MSIRYPNKRKSRHSRAQTTHKRSTGRYGTVYPGDMMHDADITSFNITFTITITYELRRKRQQTVAWQGQEAKESLSPVPHHHPPPVTVIPGARILAGTGKTCGKAFSFAALVACSTTSLVEIKESVETRINSVARQTTNPLIILRRSVNCTFLPRIRPRDSPSVTARMDPSLEMNMSSMVTENMKERMDYSRLTPSSSVFRANGTSRSTLLQAMIVSNHHERTSCVPSLGFRLFPYEWFDESKCRPKHVVIRLEDAAIIVVLLETLYIGESKMTTTQETKKKGRFFLYNLPPHSKAKHLGKSVVPRHLGQFRFCYQTTVHRSRTERPRCLEHCSLKTRCCTDCTKGCT
jgi:hypothetical protein